MERTPRSRIKGMLRQIFLRSRERANALKDNGYCCKKCGLKATTRKGEEVKLEVHHVDGISVWDDIIDKIETEVLCIGYPEKLMPLCRDCHAQETYGHTRD
jgi:predicted HNH restriction endonuclease